MLEPIPDEPAAIARISPEERVLVIADYHAGIESELRGEGLEIQSRADDRLAHLLTLIRDYSPDTVIFLGDFAHWIGEPQGAELEELQTVVDEVRERASLLLVKGNHDGKIERALDIPVSDSGGLKLGDIGFTHGHTNPPEDVVMSDVLCVGHEHVSVRLKDEVGGSREERAWLRGDIDKQGFGELERDPFGTMVVFPAFNELVGGTRVNREHQEFLAPFLPEGIRNGNVYLLDGTRLGNYRRI